MRSLRTVDAGQLRGVEVRHNLDRLTGLDLLPAPWAGQVAELIETLQSGSISGDTPEYLISSHGLPVAWATVHGGVVTPDMPMSTVQAKHQRWAAAVLADLDRETLERLADERDERAGRPNLGADYEAMLGALRVAPVHDPTDTRWVRVGADLDDTRRQVARAVGGHAEQALIVTAVGYGRHGYHTHRLSLELICAMQAVTATHPVSLATVGNWLDAEDGLAGQVFPATLPQQFTAAYIGWYASPSAYTAHRMNEQGWPDILNTHGMEPYFDVRRYERHLFGSDVTAIDIDGYQPGRGIEVFHRRSTDI